MLSRYRPSCADLAARSELTANNNKFDLCVQDQHGEEDNGIGSLEMGSIRRVTYCEGQNDDFLPLTSFGHGWA